MVTALRSYERAGFVGDFGITEGGLVHCFTCGSDQSPAVVVAHSIRRIEGASDPGDNAELVAIHCGVCRTPGVLVLRYGPETPPEHGLVARAMRDGRSDDVLPGDQSPSEVA